MNDENNRLIIARGRVRGARFVDGAVMDPKNDEGSERHCQNRQENPVPAHHDSSVTEPRLPSKQAQLLTRDECGGHGNVARTRLEHRCSPHERRR